MPYVTKQPGLRFYRPGDASADADGIVALPIGAPVPEAESLTNFAAMMRIGHLAFVDNGGVGDGLANGNDRARKADRAAINAAEKEARTIKKPVPLKVEESKKSKRASA